MYEPKTLLTYSIGLDRYHKDFRNYITAEACLIAGGCSVIGGTGHWVEGANEKQAEYYAPVLTEQLFRVEILVESNKAQWALTQMEAAVCYAAQKWEVDIDWVHVTTQWVQSHHFSVAEDNFRRT